MTSALPSASSVVSTVEQPPIPDATPTRSSSRPRQGRPLPSVELYTPTSPTKTPFKSTRFETEEAWRRQALLVKEHLALIEWVKAELVKQGGTECPELVGLFDKYFGQLAYAGGIKAYQRRKLGEWKKFFKQVCAQFPHVQRC